MSLDEGVTTPTPSQWDPKCKLFIRLPKTDFEHATEPELETAFTEILQGSEGMFSKFSPTLAKGYCFLIFDNRLSAAKAHDMLFQKAILGTVIKPVFSFTKDEQLALTAGVTDDEIERNHRTVVVKGITTDITEDMVNEFFSHFGIIKSVKVVHKKTSLAFIVFAKHHPAMIAVQEGNGQQLNGLPLHVSISENTNLLRRAEKFMMRQQYGRGMMGMGMGMGMMGMGYGGGWGYGGGMFPPWAARGRGFGGFGFGFGRGRGGFGGMMRRGRGRGGGSTVCKFFQEGKCNRGGFCTFSHPGSGGRGSAGARWTPY